MFLCENCLKSKKISFIRKLLLVKSSGKCEICGNNSLCCDWKDYKIEKKIMSVVNLDSKKIFETLDTLKHLVGLAVCDFTNNQTKREKAIAKMEIRFSDIADTVNNYFFHKQNL